LANPIRCKAKKGAAITGSEDCPSFNPGRPHEVQNNLNPREMIAIPPQAGNKTRLIVYPLFLNTVPKDTLTRLGQIVENHVAKLDC